MKTIKITPRLVSAAVLLFGLLVLPARAQMASSPIELPLVWTAAEGESARMDKAAPSSMANHEARTPQQWKALRSELLNTLRSDRGERWEEAAQQVIFLSTFFSDQINLERAAGPLLESYILERNEGRRILALAALHAIGHRDAMAHLSQRVSLERSPRVRRLTVAALGAHYGITEDRQNAGSVIIEEPVPVMAAEQQEAKASNR